MTGINYCKCINCQGKKVIERWCPCKKCSNCSIHIGGLHEEERLIRGICESCYRIKNEKIRIDIKSIDLLPQAIYDRAYQDAINGDIYERKTVSRWINSQSFLFYPRLLGMEITGLKEGFLERIKNYKESTQKGGDYKI